VILTFECVAGRQGDVSAAEARVQRAEQECGRLCSAHHEEIANLRAALQAQVCSHRTSTLCDIEEPIKLQRFKSSADLK
jgi:hypothetical protein